MPPAVCSCYVRRQGGGGGRGGLSLHVGLAQGPDQCKAVPGHLDLALETHRRMYRKQVNRPGVVNLLLKEKPVCVFQLCSLGCDRCQLFVAGLNKHAVRSFKTHLRSFKVILNSRVSS